MSPSQVGIDLGLCSCDLNPGSGRLAYRGRVMNRASRIAGVAAAGQVLVSGAAWAQITAAAVVPSPAAPSRPIAAIRLGPMALKGVRDRVEVMQCVLQP